jgi:rhodanese-related sulfurtransferase
VRSEAEFAAGHLPGFWWFPGGQAVQRADDVVAIRNAQVVFACDGIARAGITASWYRQMGFPNVFAVEGGTTAWLAAGLPLESGAAPSPNQLLKEARDKVLTVPPAHLQDALQSTHPPFVLFVGTSGEFAAGHPPGARWLSRSWLELRVRALLPDPAAPVAVANPDGEQSLLAAQTLAELGYTDVRALDGGMAAWHGAGLPVELGLTGVMSPPDDVIAAGPDRSTADMINYLRWEERLGSKYAPA